MADTITIQELRGLVLSAAEIKIITDWPDPLVEDYLNLIENMITIAEAVNSIVAENIEDIDTDFSDGSIPFVSSGFLVEDNTNLTFDNATDTLSTKIITTTSTVNGRNMGTDGTKLDGIEAGAEVNNISDVNATDLTDAGDTSLHYHSSDRNRSNHTGTQAAATISDFDTEVSNNTDVSANTTHRSSDGKNHSDVVLNNTHRGSNGSDHTYIDQSVTTTSDPTFNSISVTTTVDGRDVSVDGTKLDGIEAGATADQTGAEIKSLYEGEADTNAYTDAEKTKVGYISVTQAVDLDTMESDIATNNAKVSNATHTGDVTGSVALTIAAGAIDIAMHSATGTPSSSTFYRGDNTWSTISTGSGALIVDADTGGTDNVFLGEGTGTSNTADDNCIVGHNAFTTSNGSADKNVGIGSNIFSSATSAFENVCIGYNAATAITTENNLIAIGNTAGTSAGSFTVCIGTRTALTDAGSSVYVGYEAGENTTSNFVTGIGYQALNAATTSQYCVALGYAAMYLGASPDKSVAIGAFAMEDHYGNNSVGIGYGAGRRATSGNGNVFIGYEAGPTIGAAAVANSLYINNSESDTPLIYGSFANSYIEVNGDFITNPTVGGPSLTGNGEVSMYPTSNTNMRIAYKGTDGTTRTADITLA